jgi:pimeloyl-ACP methyl ester carboxylesterase
MVVDESTRVRRSYVDTPSGRLHYAECGSPRARETVVLLHQTPRSWDEYRDVLPLLAEAGLRAIAPDTPGYGASDPIEPSVEAWAAAIVELFDALGLGTVAVAGHHTGGVIALEVAACAPERVSALVLSSTPLVDEEFRRRPHGVDEVDRDADGGHLAALWRGRQPFYPAGRPDLLERFVRDALAAGLERSAGGHHAVRGYRMEDRLDRISTRVRLVGATADPYGYPNLERLLARLPHADVLRIEGGMVPLPDQMPEEYASAVVAFVTAGDELGARATEQEPVDPGGAS